MRHYAAISALAAGFVVLAGAGQAAAVQRSPDSADGSSSVTALSCGSPGNCSAGGYYANSAEDVTQVFVVNEKKGTWGRAAELGGIASLNVGKSAELESMSCPSAGNCSAIGFYSIGEDNRRSFVAGEKNGKWGKAQKVPGTRSLKIAGVSPIMSVSCSSAGNCAAFGTYGTDSGTTPSYVVSEARGVWHKAIRLPGVTIDAISCGAAGNCVAGGYSVAHVITSSGHAITVGEVRGKWGKPHDLTGTPAKASGVPRVTAVSCRSAGNCTAGGDYATKDGVQAFVATESKGAWRKAEQLPGIAALNVGRNSALFSLSCASAGNCSTGGYYVDAKGFEAFVADERGAPGPGRRRSPARPRSISARSALRPLRSTCSRAARPALAARPGFTPTRRAASRYLPTRRPAAAGLRRRRSPAPARSTPAARPTSWHCHARQPGTAAPAGPHRPGEAPARVRGRPAQRHLGAGADHRGPRVIERPRVRGQCLHA